MANAREIQSRMKSIKDTMKITNAMYMISSSKLSKARTDLKNTEPYFFTMQDALAKILMESPDAGNRFFDQRSDLAPEDRKKGYIVVTADKGMAGAYNHNVIKIAEEATHTGENENHNKLFVVGEVGRRYFETKNIPVDIDFKYTAQNPNMNRARYIAEQVTELFVSGELDEVYIIYTKMINSLNVQAECHQLLPLEQEQISVHRDRKYYDQVAFLPSPDEVFEHIVPNYVAGFVYGVLVESYCSEHNARMTAMQTATNAAKDMLNQLTIDYNRARQSAITQEITEVIAGAKAQKKKTD